MWRLNDVQCRFVCCINLSETVLSGRGVRSSQKGVSVMSKAGEKEVEEAENSWWLMCLYLTPPTLRLRFLEVFLSLTLCCEGRRWAPEHSSLWRREQNAEVWTLLHSVSGDFNRHSSPALFGQSLKKVHTCPIVYLQHSCVSAEETRLSSFSLFEVWFAGWVSLLSPPPPQSGPIPPSEDLTWNDFHIGLILAADWPGESALPQGSPTNGDTAAWLIGRGQVAPLHFSFFCFKQQPLHCLFFCPFYHLVLRPWERGAGSPVVRTFTKFSPTLNALWITPRYCFSFLLITCSVAIMDVVIRTLRLWG